MMNNTNKMQMNTIRFHCCPVCGAYYENYFPWGNDGQTPSNDICACCRVEWGYEDFREQDKLEFRVQWLKKGAIWADEKYRPQDWNLREQLINIMNLDKVDQLLEQYVSVPRTASSGVLAQEF